jgi:hypothetical protein
VRCDWRQDLEATAVFYDDTGRLIGEEDISGTVRSYLYAPAERIPIATRQRMKDGTFEVFFYHENSQGDIVAISDKQEAIKNRYHYGPFERRRESQRPSINPSGAKAISTSKMQSFTG